MQTNRKTPPLRPILLLTLLCSGCIGTRPLRGGRAAITHTPSGAVQQTLAQSDNPSQPTRQDQETIRTRTYTLPAGSRIESTPKTPLLHHSNTPSTSITLSAPTTITEREESRANTELGAAQKDTARELSAKLSSLKSIVWVGLALFIFGAASLVWPPLKLIIGSVTTSAAIILGGLALMILPTLVVGNELLILGAVAVTVGAWFLAHRHGHLCGQVAATSNNFGLPSESHPQAQPPSRHGRRRSDRELQNHTL